MSEKSLICSDEFARLPDGEAVNPAEAPTGFRAERPQPSTENICRQCDWRKQCNDPATDNLAFGHRCRSMAIVRTSDGLTYRRQDRCMVVFKRNEVSPDNVSIV